MASGENDELHIGDRFTQIVKLTSENPGDDLLREIWGEIHLEARPDVPHAGYIDRQRALSTPEAFVPADFPWVLRLTAIEHLIRHRLYLKSLLVSYGVADRDFRLPSELADVFPVERFPEFETYAEELGRLPTSGEEQDLKNRLEEVILAATREIREIDRELRNSTGVIRDFVLQKRARAMAEAPRLLEVGFREGTFHVQKNLYERIGELPQHGEGSDRSDVGKEIVKSLLFALAENQSAIEALIKATKEVEIDPLFESAPLLMLTIARYPEFKEAFRTGYRQWNDRVDRRNRKSQKELMTSSAISGGLVLVGFIAPYVGASFGIARIASLTGTALIGVEGWKTYWKAYADWSLKRATFAGAELLLSRQEYLQAREAFGEEIVASLSTAVFFLPGLAAWGRGVALFNGEAKGLSRILSTLDRYASETERTSRFALWRARIARYSIARIEQRLSQSIRMGSRLEANEAHLALARRPVAFSGLRYHWRTDLEKVTAESRAHLPRFWPFQKEAIDESLNEVKRVAGILASKEGGPGELWKQIGSSIRTSIENRANRQLAMTFISTNTVMKFAIESLIRNGDVWEEKRLFGRIPIPKKGILINLTIGNTVLGVMAFASHIQNPFLKVIPSVLVTGGATALAEFGYTGHAEPKRVAAEMAYNMAAVWFTVPVQIQLADFLQQLPRTSGMSYVAYRASWAATGYVVSGTHSRIMLKFFENAGSRQDYYGNYFRTQNDDSTYRIPKGAYQSRASKG